MLVSCGDVITYITVDVLAVYLYAICCDYTDFWEALKIPSETFEISVSYTTHYSIVTIYVCK